jgi:hypothetical protein
MPLTRTRFTSENAPCGRLVDGERHQDRDPECMLTDHRSYACGCRSISHEYHDGSWSQRVVRHDGSVLVDEFLSAE